MGSILKIYVDLFSPQIGAKRIHLVRTRGGNRKYRALRLETGNFSWGAECNVLLKPYFTSVEEKHCNRNGVWSKSWQNWTFWDKPVISFEKFSEAH